jgi:hypothetical protein
MAGDGVIWQEIVLHNADEVVEAGPPNNLLNVTSKKHVRVITLRIVIFLILHCSDHSILAVPRIGSDIGIKEPVVRLLENLLDINNRNTTVDMECDVEATLQHLGRRGIVSNTLGLVPNSAIPPKVANEVG